MKTPNRLNHRKSWDTRFQELVTFSLLSERDQRLDPTWSTRQRWDLPKLAARARHQARSARHKGWVEIASIFDCIGEQYARAMQ